MTQIDPESPYYRNWMPNNHTNAQASDSDCESELNSPEIQYQSDIIAFEEDLDTPSPMSNIPAIAIVQKSFRTE
ncbi:hypothetical protein Q9L58_008597, partial [Maublancomyces gigas]